MEPSRAHQEMTASFRIPGGGENSPSKIIPVEIVPWQPPPPPPAFLVFFMFACYPQDCVSHFFFLSVSCPDVTPNGYPPTAISYPPTAIGYSPTAIGYPPTRQRRTYWTLRVFFSPIMAPRGVGPPELGRWTHNPPRQDAFCAVVCCFVLHAHLLAIFWFRAPRGGSLQKLHRPAQCPNVNLCVPKPKPQHMHLP